MPKHATCYYYPTSGTVVSGTVVLRFLEKTIRADSFCANVLLRPSPREVRVRRKGKRGKEVGKETMKRRLCDVTQAGCDVRTNIAGCLTL